MNFENEKLLSIRSNIVKWYPFDKEANALVIGDETGEITKFLSGKVKEVTVIEETEEIYQNLIAEAMLLQNVTVIKDKFLEFQFENQFQYIIMFGCLYFKMQDSQNIEMMNKAKNLLTTDGTILLALNNCVSLKFLSETDKNNININGLTKIRLEKILEAAKLDNYKFYYPLPDYKITNVIFTDELLPSSIELERNIDLKQEVATKNFDDRRVLAGISENSKYDFKYYCSSFLVEIKAKSFKNDVKAVYFNNVRKEAYRLVTEILEEDVIKYSTSEESEAHLQRLFENVNILKQVGINTLDICEENKIKSRYVKNGITLQEIFLKNLRQNRFGEIGKIIERYKNELLLKLQVVGSANNVFEKYHVAISQEKLDKLTFVKYGLWDLILQNIFVIENEFYVYDQEWCEQNVPIEFILYRSIKYLAQVSNEDRDRLYKVLNIEEFLEEFLQLENIFQDGLLDNEVFSKYLNSLKAYQNMNINEKEIYEFKLEEKNQELNQLRNEKEQEIETLKNEKMQEIEKLETQKNQLIENYEKEMIFKQGIMDSKEMMNRYINKELNDFATAYKVLNKEIAKLQKALELKNQEVINICASQQYIQGAISLKRREQLYPIVSTFRGIKKITGKIFRPIKRGVLSVIRKLGKAMYELYPVKAHKRALKNKFLYSDKLAKIGKIKTYKEYCYAENIDKILLEDGTEEYSVKFQVGLNKTIGIHLHLYYEDLLEEFYRYFCHIPYVFDLYVSVREGVDTKKIAKKFNEILNLNKVRVVATPNSGRDFGPMFVEFREALKQYDYVMHVHSKKSLRMGNDQADWRHYMLDHLLGSTERIMKNFYLMEQMGMGMVYVDSFSGPCPYWINTWLGEAPLARKILNQMGMECKDEILQFPAGSMFWAKKDALRQLFDLDLTWEDFGFEDGSENEATLAYVFERITGKVAKHNGYDIAIYNVEEKRYRKNKGEQLFKEYFAFNKDNIFNMLLQFDIVSFDIFDTLITRTVYEPNDSFKIIENKIKAKGIPVENYFELRKQAESNVRKNKNFEGDCNIHEIYEEFQKITGLSNEDVNWIKETEIQTELDLVIPRMDMLYVYNRLLQCNKKIVLVSDMYLTKDMIEKMLNKCGYCNWFDLMISSELGYRKDNGTMWNYFFEKYGNCFTNHIGDNEFSDVHAVAKKAKPSFHIMKGTKLNDLMPQRYIEDGETLNLLESIVMGSVINRVVCNSPFAMNNIENRSMINNYFDFGYAVLGPVIFNYMLWIIKMAKQEKNGEVLLFAAREGYYLQKIYQIFKEKLGGLENVKDHYLYISRRAVTVLNINTLQDIREIMEKDFHGTLREVLYYRLNYKGNNFEDEVIYLPQDIEKVMKVVEENFDEILANAKKEKETYLKYIESLNIDFEHQKVSMIDLGYAGTAQYYLAKLLNQKIAGKYFCVQVNLKPVQLGCEVYSCYNKNIYSNKINKNILFQNSLFLESFLTAPDGQFLYMDDEGVPQFLHEKNKKEQMEKFDEVYQGVKEFTETILDLMGNSVFDYEIDHKYIFRCYENCLNELYKFDDKMKSLFFIEDYYCSNAVLDGLEVFKNRKKDWNYE